MNRRELEHIIRAACEIADDQELIILGSQAILGSWPQAPAELTVSMEADVYPRNRPGRADLIDGTIGELSPFHQTFGYYAHGVAASTAVLPAGWQDRLVPICNENTRGSTGWCLEVHDLALSKLVAGRPKDLAYVEALVLRRLADLAEIGRRLQETEIDGARRQVVAGRIERLARAAGGEA